MNSDKKIICLRGMKIYEAHKAHEAYCLHGMFSPGQFPYTSNLWDYHHTHYHLKHFRQEHITDVDYHEIVIN